MRSVRSSLSRPRRFRRAFAEQEDERGNSERRDGDGLSLGEIETSSPVESDDIAMLTMLLPTRMVTSSRCGSAFSD